MWFESFFIFMNTETITLSLVSLVWISLMYAFWDSAQRFNNLVLKYIISILVIWIFLIWLIIMWWNILAQKNINMYDKLDSKITNTK